MKIEYKLVNTSTGTPNVSVNHNIYEFFYPCETNYDCTDYEVILPKGRYYFEAYGASGGIHSNVYTSSYVDKNRKCSNDTSAQAHANVVCDPSKYSSGPGGYVRAALNLSRETVAYIIIGGQGAYGKGSLVPGGYGGGGDGHKGAAAGGGRTALMMQKDDIFHSVLVAGAGGGSDDAANNNDGIAGSGGGLIGQSFWFSSTYIQGYEANSSHFFSYGNGESVHAGKSNHPQGSIYQTDPDFGYEYSGAGGGWFGGFASFDPNAGSGGGSSFALTKDAIIPTTMDVYDTYYSNKVTDNYAFDRNSMFIMSDVIHFPGIWIGNGMFRVT